MFQRSLNHLFAPIILLGILLVLRFEALLLFSSHYLGGVEGDAGLYVWLARSFHSDPIGALRLEGNAFYPYGLVRAWSDNFILPSAIFSLLAEVGFSEPAAYNLVLLGAAVLNGYVVYLLARKLGGSFSAALCSGAFFETLPYFSSHLGHPQLQFVFFLPLTIILSLNVIDQRSLKSGVLLGLSLSAALYTTANYAVMPGLVSLTLILIATCYQPQQLIGPWIFGALLGAIPAIPCIDAYLSVSAEFGPRKLYEAYAFQAEPLSFLTSSKLNPLWQTLPSSNNAEAWLFMGYVASIGLLVRSMFHRNFTILTLVFASVALYYLPTPFVLLAPWFLAISGVLTIKNNRASWLSALGLFFAALAMGPVLDPNQSSLVLTPFSLLSEIVPGMNSVRAVARFATIPMLSLCITPLINTKISPLLLFFVLILHIVEVRKLPIALEPLVPRPTILDELSKEDVILILPISGPTRSGRIESWGKYAVLNIRAMNWTVGSKAKLINGYSGQRPRLHERLPAILDAEVLNDTALGELSQIHGLNKVVDFRGEPRVIDFVPRLSAHQKPTYLLIDSIRNQNLKFEIVDGNVTCSLKYGFSSATSDEALLRALDRELLLSSKVRPEIELPSSKTRIKPRILSLASSCPLILKPLL